MLKTDNQGFFKKKTDAFKQFFSVDMNNKLLAIFFIALAFSFLILLISLVYNMTATFLFISPYYQHSFFSDLTFTFRMSLMPSPYIPVADDYSIYPPLPLAFLRLFGLLTNFVLLETAEDIVVAVTYISIMLAIPFMVYKLCNLGSRLMNVLFVVAFFISMPYIFAFERGNIVAWSLFFLLLFLIFYTSKSNAKRDISYLFLAVAFNIKFYFLIFILIMVFDKNFWGIVKTLSCCIVLFFLPFLAFEGGFSNVGIFLNNMTGWFNGLPVILNNNITIRNFLYIITGIGWSGNVAAVEVIKLISGILSCLLLFSSVAASFFLKQKHKILFIFSALMLLVPEISFQYVLIAMIVPAVAFFNEKEKTKKDIIPLIFYIILFLSCPLGYIVRPPSLTDSLTLTVNTILQNVALLGVCLYYTAEGLGNAVKLMKEGRFWTKVKNLILFRKEDPADTVCFTDGLK